MMSLVQAQQGEPKLKALHFYEVLFLSSFSFPFTFLILNFTSIMQNITFEFYISLLYLNQMQKDI